VSCKLQSRKKFCPPPPPIFSHFRTQSPSMLPLILSVVNQILMKFCCIGMKCYTSTEYISLVLFMPNNFPCNFSGLYINPKQPIKFLLTSIESRSSEIDSSSSSGTHRLSWNGGCTGSNAVIPLTGPKLLAVSRHGFISSALTALVHHFLKKDVRGLEPSS
jgi:hypothetical protein